MLNKPFDTLGAADIRPGDAPEVPFVEVVPPGHPALEQPAPC
jgi:hypothetical protein